MYTEHREFYDLLITDIFELLLFLLFTHHRSLFMKIIILLFGNYVKPSYFNYFISPIRQAIL